THVSPNEKANFLQKEKEEKEKKKEKTAQHEEIISKMCTDLN
ncbi:hypothetical protein HJC23_010148, partial [Cyclotella cryptica]